MNTNSCLECNSIIPHGYKRCEVCQKERNRKSKEKGRHKLKKTCPDCGISILDESKYCALCNQKHRPIGNGLKIHEAKLRNGSYPKIGIETIASNGYIMVKTKNGNSGKGRPHGMGNYEAKHRLIIEEAIGRKLSRKEHVHHIDGNKTNNDIDNLVLLTDKQHNKVNYFVSLLNELSQADGIKVVRTLKIRYPNLF